MSRPLTDLVEVNPGMSLPSDLPLDAEVSFIPMGDVSEDGEWRQRQTRKLLEVQSGFTAFREGDVLFAKITPCMENGKGAHAVGLRHGIGFGSTEFHVLRARPGVSSRYVHHLAQSPRLRIAAEAHMIGSAGQQRVQKQFFDRYSVPGFPIAEQDLIAQILDILDTQIRQTEALIVKLEQIKQGLLTDLLTRGIDENGQLRTPPDQAPHLYKDSPLGWIPREWKTVEIAKLGEIVTGSTPPSSDPGAWGLALPFVTPADIGENDLIQVAERAVSERGKRYVRQVPPGSTLVVCIGSTIGKIGFCTMHAATNQQINALVPRDEHDPYFVFQAVRRHVGQIMGWAGLQAVPIVNKSMFGRMLVPVPPRTEQAAVSERMRAVDNRMVQEVADLAKLRNQKAGLMNDLLTGRARVTPLLNTAEPAAG